MFIKRSILFLIFLFSVSLLYIFFLKPAIACTTGNNYNYRPACDCKEQCNSYSGGGVYGIACNNSGCDGHTYQCLDIAGGCSGIGGGGAKCNGGYHEECKKSCSPQSAKDGSCSPAKDGSPRVWCRVRTCTQAAPTVPTLLTPANGSVVQTTTGQVTLTWQKVAFGVSCNPPQKNTLTVYAGPTGGTIAPVYVFSDTTVPIANQATSYVYTIPASIPPGTSITWYLFVNNNCPDLTKTSAKWTFIYQSGISGTVYYDPDNICSTSRPWNLGGALKVNANNGITANVSGTTGAYSLGTVPGTYNITLTGNSASYVCSDGCAQSCPAKTGLTSPSGGNNFFLTFKPGPWWQVMNSDVSTNGNLGSLLMAPNLFDLKGAGGFPGVPTYGGSLSGITGDTVSETKWIANTKETSPKVYNYQFFANQVPTSVTFNIIKAGDDVAADLNSPDAVADGQGYYWFKYDASTTGNQALDLPAVDVGNRKVILFVNAANLNINGSVNLTDGSGLFVAIVGQDTAGNGGSIIVNSSVGGSATPDIKGIFFADKNFKDSTQKPASDDIKLRIRGSVVAYGSVSLQRDLGAENLTTPAEFFVYAPEQMVLFPKALSVRRISWKEVAP